MPCPYAVRQLYAAPGARTGGLLNNRLDATRIRKGLSFGASQHAVCCKQQEHHAARYGDRALRDAHRQQLPTNYRCALHVINTWEC